MSNKDIILEVCCGDIESVQAAAAGGAQRVELCSALAEGGVTPSIGLIRMARKVPGLILHVLIRARGGDFVYTPEEVDCMVADIEAARAEGADGVVIGALTPDGEIDMASCRRMVAAAEGMNVTFHRAYDLCSDPQKAFDQIVELGCNRLLTSGQAASAAEGTAHLQALVDRAPEGFTILPAAGVTPQNAAQILRESGANELHASARHSVPSAMRQGASGVSMGSADDASSRKVTSAAIVSGLMAACGI